MATKQKISAIKKGVDGREVAKRIAFTVLVGVVSAFASIVLCLCVGFARDRFIEFPWLLYCLPLLGIVSLLLYRLLKLPLDLTTHRIMSAMQHNEHIPITLAPGILLGTCITILGGGSVGKEAGALQIGASISSFIGKKMHVKSIYRTNPHDAPDANTSVDADATTELEESQKVEGYTAAIGMAATFSALFFAPLGSALFVLEQNKFKRSMNKHLVSIVVACFIAFAISSYFGIGDAINTVAIPEVTPFLVGQCAVVGLAAAIIGSLIANAISWVHDITWRISKNYYLWVVVGGVIYITLVVLLGWDTYTGSGGVILNDLLKGDGSFEPGGFAIKALLTLICLGFWFKGGEIMPSLCIGGLLGAACTYLTGGNPEFGAVVGIVSYFAAFSHCPIGAFFMGCEIFGWGFAPWLAIGVVVAMLCASPIGAYGEGVDEAIRTRWRHMLKDSFKQRYTSLRQNDIAHKIDVPDVMGTTQDAVTALRSSFAQENTLVAPEKDKPEPLVIERKKR